MNKAAQLQKVRVQSMRHIVAGLPHDEALLVQRALTAYSKTLLAVDQAFPDPDKREYAAQADKLADRFRDANIARDYIESKLDSDSFRG